MEHRIVFKILLLVFKFLNNLATTYISDILTQYSPSRSLMSSKIRLLVVPRSIQKTYGDRVFAVAGPRLWNALPIHKSQDLPFFFFKKKSLFVIIFLNLCYFCLSL